MQLCMKTDPQGKVPVNRVVKTFASGRRDTKDVIKYLDDLELRNRTEKGKVSSDIIQGYFDVHRLVKIVIVLFSIL